MALEDHHATAAQPTEELIFTEIYCCGILHGYIDQHGREYDLEKRLLPEKEQKRGAGSDQYYSGTIAGYNPSED